MKGEATTFVDPKGKFTIRVPTVWKYRPPDDADDDLCQFEIDDSSFFQISCRQINDHIAQLIKVNNFKDHNFELANLSYYERIERNQNFHSYVWMCPIEGHFILAMYVYDPSRVGKDF